VALVGDAANQAGVAVEAVGQLGQVIGIWGAQLPSCESSLGVAIVLPENDFVPSILALKSEGMD
jgi:hypothetical protein